MRRLCAALFAIAGPLNAMLAPARDLWIDNVTVSSPERTAPLSGASVRIQGERIVEISDHAVKHARDAREIDGRGRFLVPGLIDGHVHLGYIAGMRPDQERAHPEMAHAARAQVPKSFLYFGFTTLVDLSSTPRDMQRWNSAPLKPDTYFCGGVAVPDGYPMNFMPLPLRYELMPYFVLQGGAPPAGTNAAEHTPQAVAARMRADGAICMKTFYETGFGPVHDLPVASLETLQSLVKAAHELNLPVLMHANSSNAQRVGNQAGVDVLAHGLWNWSEPYRVVAPTPDVTQILDQVVADHRGYQPTIQVLYGERNLFDESLLSSPLMKKAVPAGLIAWYRSPEGQWFHDQLAKAMDLPAHPKPEMIDTSAIARVNAAVAYLAKRDAHFLFGSDTPSDETFANPPGLNGWWELHRLVEAGLSPAQLFKAATLANATTFGIGDEVGSVQVGKRANLLLLDEDPAVTVHAFDRIKLIILHGAVIDPATLAADAGKGPQ